MLNQKQTYILILILLLFPSSVVYSAWSEPSQAPTGGNAAVPLYSEGSGQTLNGTLSVDPAATNAFPLQANGSDTGVLGTGVLKGLQGNSPATAVFGNLSSNAAIGDKAVYGLAVDPNDYSASFSGGLGVDVASGDIRFRSRGPGIAWPRVLDEVPLAGLSVSSGGELRLYAHGGGINFFDQNLVSRLTVSEVGAVNVVTPIAQGGALKLNNVNVCLSDGTNCPAPPPPPAGSNLWLPNGNDIYPNFSGAVKLNHDLQFNGDTAANAVIDFDPWEGNLGNYFLIQSGISPTFGNVEHLRINRTGETLLGGNLFIGKGGSVASMTPYNDPTANVSWKVGLVGGVSTIEAEPGPGGNPGGRGDINLKTGTLKTKWINSDNSDVIMNDILDSQWDIKNTSANNGGNVYINDTFKVQGQAAFGGYDIDPNGFAVTTPFIWSNQGFFDKIRAGNPAGGWLTGAPPFSQTGGFVNAEKLCIQGVCMGSWGEATSSGGWTKSGSSIYPTTLADNVGVGNNNPGAYKLNVTGDANATRLCIAGVCKSNWASAQNFLEVLQTGGNALAYVGDTVIGGRLALGSGNLGYPLHVVSDGSTSILNLDSKLAAPVNYWTGLRLARKTSEKWFVGMDNLTDNLLFRRAVAANDMIIDTAGQVGIGITPTSRLHIKPVGNEEGLRVAAGSWSPFIIRDTADSADLFRIDQTGKTAIGNFSQPLSRMLEIKGDTNGNPGEFLMTLQNINSNNGASLALITPQAAGVGGGYAVTAYRRTSAGGDGWNVGLTPADNVYRVASRVAAVNADRLTIDPSSGLVTLGTLKVTGGAPGAGKILTSDAAGLASWAAPVGVVPAGTSGQTLRVDASNNWVANNVINNDGANVTINGLASTLNLRGNIMNVDNPSPFYLNAQGNIQLRLDYDQAFAGGNNQLTIVNGSNNTVFSVDEGGSVKDVTSYCLGANCKSTDWGPKGATVDRTFQSATPNGERLTCPAGYVMVGIENSSPSKLICQRMW